MVFALVYSIISTGIFVLVYLAVSKKWSRLTIRKPLIVSMVNFLLTVLVFSLFLFNPASFGSNVAIDNKADYILFSVFATYFYIFIIPLAGLQIVVTLKNNCHRLIMEIIDLEEPVKRNLYDITS